MDANIRSSIDKTVRVLTKRIEDENTTASDLTLLTHALCDVARTVNGTFHYNGTIPDSVSTVNFGTALPVTAGKEQL